MNNCSCVSKDHSPAYEDEKTLEVKLKWGALKFSFENTINNLIKKVEAKFDLDKDEAPYYGRYDGLYCANQMLFSPVHDHISMGGKVAHLIETRYLFDVVKNVTDYLGMSHQGGYRTLKDYQTNPVYQQALISGLDMAIQAFESIFEKKNIVVWVMQYYFKSHSVNYGLAYAEINASFNPSRVNYWNNEIITYLNNFLVSSLEYKRFSYEIVNVFEVKQKLIGTFNLNEGMKVKLGLDENRCPLDVHSKVLFTITKEMKELCKNDRHYTVSKLYKRVYKMTDHACFSDSEFEGVVFEGINWVWPTNFLVLDQV